MIILAKCGSERVVVRIVFGFELPVVPLGDPANRNRV